MSSTTPNLGLHQWASTDYVNHEDFNSDNRKIDAAFSHVNRFPIREYTTSAATSNLSIDISDIDWSEYDYVFVEVTASAASAATFAVLLNTTDTTLQTKGRYITPGMESYSDTGLGQATFNPAESGTRKHVFRLRPFKSPGNYFMCDTLSDIFPYWGYSTLKYSDAEALILLGGGVSLSPGAHINIYGIK